MTIETIRYILTTTLTDGSEWETCEEATDEDAAIEQAEETLAGQGLDVDGARHHVALDVS